METAGGVSVTPLGRAGAQNGSGEQDRRQSHTRLRGQRVPLSEDLEQLQQALPGGGIVPLTVASHAFEQLVDGFLPGIVGQQRVREIDARLMIIRIRLDLGLQR